MTIINRKKEDNNKNFKSPEGSKLTFPAKHPIQKAKYF